MISLDDVKAAVLTSHRWYLKAAQATSGMGRLKDMAMATFCMASARDLVDQWQAANPMPTAGDRDAIREIRAFAEKTLRWYINLQHHCLAPEFARMSPEELLPRAPSVAPESSPEGEDKKKVGPDTRADYHLSQLEMDAAWDAYRREYE